MYDIIYNYLRTEFKSLFNVLLFKRDIDFEFKDLIILDKNEYEHLIFLRIRDRKNKTIGYKMLKDAYFFNFKKTDNNFFINSCDESQDVGASIHRKSEVLYVPLKMILRLIKIENIIFSLDENNI